MVSKKVFAVKEKKYNLKFQSRFVMQMKLTKVEQETLSHLMVGLTCIEIAKLYNANRTTIWRRQNRIKQKYMTAFC